MSSSKGTTELRSDEPAESQFIAPVVPTTTSQRQQNKEGEIIIMPKNLDDLELDGQDFLLIYMGHQIEKDPDVENILKKSDKDQDLLH